MSKSGLSQYLQEQEEMNATSNYDDLKDELDLREQSHNLFPLEVFHPKIKPFIEMMHKYYDIPRAFIGLSMLTAYSTAIGNGYWFVNKKLGRMPLTIWGALVGMSSSGKSVIMSQLFKPLKEIQSKFDDDWMTTTDGMSQMDLHTQRLRKLTFQDIMIPTLVRYVLPDNPKGMLKFSDEILEWINGMNPNNRKEGNEEQFWLKCWDGGAHQITRSGKQEVSLSKMFINNFGSIQPTVLDKLFKNNRDTTGFIFRFLFAVTDDRDKIALPSLDFDMPSELEMIHAKAIKSMYWGIQPEDLDNDIRSCILDPNAIREFDGWRMLRGHKINKIDDEHDRNLQGGIFGKMNAYALRLAAILHVSDKAYENLEFQQEEIIDQHTMTRALKLVDYFYQSAVDTHKKAKLSSMWPPEAVRISVLIRQGKSYGQIGELEWPNTPTATARKRAERAYKKWFAKFPELFGKI